MVISSRRQPVTVCLFWPLLLPQQKLHDLESLQKLHQCDLRRRTVDNQSKWSRNIDALNEYVSMNGHSKVPSMFVIKHKGSTIGLGTWVAYIRTKYRNGTLKQDKIQMLESIPGWVWNPGKPGPAGNPERDKEIIKQRESGAHLQFIADKYNLSRQRVHQIIERAKLEKITKA